MNRTGIVLSLCLTIAFGVASSGVCEAGDAALNRLEQEAFRAATARVAPSVVRIETIGGVERPDPAHPGSGPTTGLIVSADGYLVSGAFGFTDRPASILVRLADGSRKPAKLIATDRSRQFVVLKIEPDRPLPVPEVAPLAGLRVGQWTIAVGRVFDDERPNMAVGVLSALNRVWGKAVQTDAAVSPNNYGGPLIDIQGRTIGILVPLSPQSVAETAGVEWYDSGIGFAVPLETILALLPRLQQGRDLLPGAAGITMKAEIASAEPIVSGCRPNSPARKAGLRNGDRIVAVEGRSVSRASQVKEEVLRRYAGDSLRLTVERDGSRFETSLQLVDRIPPAPQAFLGIRPLRSPIADAKVRLRSVAADSPAAKAGLQAGDLLLSVDGRPIRNLHALREALYQNVPGEKPAIEYERAGEKRSGEVTLAARPEAMPAEDASAAHAPSVPPPPADPKAATPPAETGIIELALPEAKTSAVLYVPPEPFAGAPRGFAVWLLNEGETDVDAWIARWRPACDRYGLILAVPKPREKRWKPSDLDILPVLAAHTAARCRLDPLRTAVGGRRGAGTLAVAAVFQYSQVFRAAAAWDASPVRRPTTQEPPQGLAFLLMHSPNEEATKAAETIAGSLRTSAYPVTLRPTPTDPPDEEIEPWARWIDALDRM